MPESRSSCWMTFSLGMAGLGVVMGITVFFVFSFLYGNIHAGLWALGSGILAAIVLHLHLLFLNHRLPTWHTVHSLAANRNLGLLTLAFSIGATVYYIYTAISEHQPVYPIEDSYMIAGVWSFMTAKWSLGLVIYGHRYKRMLLEEYTLL